MKSINLVITLCMYFSHTEGIFSHPSSHHSQQGHLARRRGFQGLGGFGMPSGLGSLSQKNDNSGGGGCSKYKIVSARGTGENQLMPTGYKGFIEGVLSAVPGGGNYEVVYPATVDYVNGPIQGATDAVRYLSEQHKQCSNQLYVFVGYSEGAMVITQTMNKISIPSSSVAAVTLYGNPYFKGGASQNACSAKGGSGIAAAMGVGMPQQFSSRTFDCCITGDMICQTVGSMVPHLAYPGSSSEKEAIEFVSSKLKVALNGSHSSGSNDNEGSTSSGDEDNGDNKSYKGKTFEQGSKSVKDKDDELTGASDGKTNEDKTGTGTSAGTGLPSLPGLSSGTNPGRGMGLPSFPGVNGYSGMGKMSNFANGLPGMTGI